MISSKRGFSLIEVMVALTILGLIAAVLTAGTRLGIGISSKASAAAEKIRTDQIGRTLLRNQLQGALPFHYSTQVQDNRVQALAFEGTADRIRFVSRMGLNDGPDSLPRWVDLYREKGLNGESKLIVEERRILPPDNQPSETTSARAQILTCTDVGMEYLDTTGQKPQWQQAWSGLTRGALPDAVRIVYRTEKETLRLLIPLDYAESARQGMWLQ